MVRIPVALQLWSVREDCASDLAGTLKAIAQMGYDGVEFAGYHNHSAKDIRKMLDDNGLVAAGTHTQLPSVTGDELMKTIEFNKELGNPYLVVPGLAEERRNSADALKKTADMLSEAAQKAVQHDMRVGYHNHDWEFRPVDGQIPWQILFDNADPSVIMQFDTGNALKAGGKAEEWIRRYPGRAETVHLKEFAANNPKPIIGSGDVPWKRVFEVCESIGGTKWYIVEEETRPYPPLESVKRSIDALKGMGKV